MLFSADNKRPSITSQYRIQSFAFCLALVAAVCVSICFVASSVGKRVKRSNEIRLESRINPNYAPPVSLMRLPGIGISRAEVIAAYRESFGNSKVFGSCDDLQKVKGIGPKTAKDICRWLKFE